jgi:hypothetical protein
MFGAYGKVEETIIAYSLSTRCFLAGSVSVKTVIALFLFICFQVSTWIPPLHQPETYFKAPIHIVKVRTCVTTHWLQTGIKTRTNIHCKSIYTVMPTSEKKLLVS